MSSLLNHLDSSDVKAEERSILVHAISDERDSSEEEELGNTVESSQQGLYAEMADKEPSRLGLRATARLSFQFCILWVSSQTVLFNIRVQAN